MMNRLHRSFQSLARRPEFRSEEAIASACLGVAIVGVDILLVIGAFIVLVHFSPFFRDSRRSQPHVKPAKFLEHSQLVTNVRWDAVDAKASEVAAHANTNAAPISAAHGFHEEISRTFIRP
jgi:hypothetical protein